MSSPEQGQITINDLIREFRRKMADELRAFPEMPQETEKLLNEYYNVLTTVPEVREAIEKYKIEHPNEPLNVSVLFTRGDKEFSFQYAAIDNARLLSLGMKTPGKGVRENASSLIDGISINYVPEQHGYTINLHHMSEQFIDGRSHVELPVASLFPLPSSKKTIQEGRDFLRRIQTLLLPEQAPLEFPLAA